MATREAARASFLDAWTSMASLFSFSPSTARVIGLLLTSGAPLSPAQIADRLAISRGNVSMCLRELRGWGVVQRVPRPGDRSEYYESRGDLFEQTIAIARERKRREFDPVIGSALAALASLEASAGREEADKLAGVAQYLGVVDRIGREVLDDPGATSTLIGLLKVTYGRSTRRKGRR
jgi:DNA-binding transcriptional regulator GbsR (MarR family)